MIRFVEKLPSVEEYLYLYNNVGWGNRDDAIIKEALDNSIYGICVYDDEKIIGMARVIGDKTIFLYVHDVIIVKDYQMKGIGESLMIRNVNKLKEYQKLYPGMRVYLGASKGKEVFYKRVGFKTRKEAHLGEGMILSN